MMPSVSGRSILYAATQIYVLEWIGWRRLLNRRPGSSRMSGIPSTFSADDAQTGSKDWYGRVMAGSYYIRDYQKAVSNGRAARRRSAP